MEKVEILTAIEKEKYKKNKNKIVEKYTIEYCSKKCLIPFIQINGQYRSTLEDFKNFLPNYKNKFPNSVIFDALWAFYGYLMTKIGSSNLSIGDYYYSMFGIRKAQFEVLKIEGNIELALRNYFESVVYIQVSNIYHSKENLDSVSKKPSDISISVDAFLKNEWEMARAVDEKVVGPIAKKCECTIKELFDEYKYEGSIPFTILSSEQINSAICKYLKL